jgi:CubicO group peptidase (beta-lactamase class C family)
MTGRRILALALGWAAAVGLAVSSPCLEAASNPGASAVVDAQRVARAEAVVREEMQRQRIPGLSIAVIDHGRVALARGYGYANLEHDVPVTVDTLFQSGSVGKQFTAAMVMLLVEDGRLSLDDPVTKYLPECPPGWTAIHVRHLLTHTSGIRDYAGAAGFDSRRAYTEGDLVRMACAQPREFQPGERFSYSNTGYLLLGAIVSRIGGRHYSEQLHDRVFKPLGMTSARLIDEAAIIKHRAAGYRLLDGQVANQEWVDPTLNTTGDGALYLSLNDMVAWAQGLRAGAILKPESWRQVYTPVTLTSGRSYPYGFGWNVTSYNGIVEISHSGSWQGFKTQILRYDNDGLVIIVLCNLGDASPGRIARRVGAAVRDDLRAPMHNPVPDPEPQRQVALRQFMQRAATGNLTLEDLPHVEGGFQPDSPTSYRSGFDGLGELQFLQLTAREPIGDDLHLEYLATFVHGQRVVDYVVDARGGTVEFSLEPLD